MTVSATTNRNSYVGAGSTGPYAYAFRVFQASDLLVVTRDLNGIETTLVTPNDFTATGVGDRDGGTITLANPLLSGWALSIRRNRPFTQTTELRNQGPYFPETVEDAFDNATMVDQQLNDALDRSVRLPETVDPDTFSTALPANMVPGDAIVVNATGDGFAMGPLSAATLSAWSAAQNQHRDVFTSSGGFTPGTTTTLTLSFAPGSIDNVWVVRRTSGVTVMYETDEFSVSGTTLTFSVAIPTGTTRVEVRYFKTFQINTADSHNVTYTPASGPGSDVQTRLRAIDAAIVNLPNDIEGLHVKDFGVIGDGSTNDTTAMQAALTAGASQNKIVYGGNCVVKITGALTMSGPGLVFDSVPHGDSGGPGLKVTGTGYVALTVSGIVSAFAVTVWGTGNTANGIQFQNPILSHIAQTRVFGLDGFGVKINKCYDCLFGTISVEQCGSASNYAFSINDDGDSSNMSHILRLQVEQAKQRAIYVSPNTLQCVIHDIHSEQATASAVAAGSFVVGQEYRILSVGTTSFTAIGASANTIGLLFTATGVGTGTGTAAATTWYLGGNRSEYSTGRFTALVPSANATLHINGGNADYNNLLVEGSIAVQAQASTILTIGTAEVQGTFGVVSGQTGIIQILGGNYTSFASDAAFIRMFGGNISTLTVGFASNPVDPTSMQFFGTTISALASSSTLSAATFHGCKILEGNNLLRGATVLNGSNVTCVSTVAHSSGLLSMTNSTLTAALTYTNHAAMRLRAGSKITGTVSCGDAGNVDLLCDDSSTVGASSSGVGIPTDGAHVKGDRHRNPAPAVGSPKAWTCTASGTPGTWISEGNL